MTPEDSPLRVRREPPAGVGLGEPPERSWHAELCLGFAYEGGRTTLAGRRHMGPLRVQKPFYPEGARICHVYVLHPPGGLVGGDSLHISTQLAAGAHALVTTPAAAKVYRTTGAASRQAVHVAAGSGATVEWLPQETIVFDGAKARLQTRVDLAAGARALLCDIVCLGRPAAGERFTQGSLTNHVEVFCDGRAEVIDRTRALGGSDALEARWGMGGHAAMGTLYAHPASPPALDAVRELPDHPGVLWSSTVVSQTLMVRAFAADATRVRVHLIALWQLLRPLVLGVVATPPRIWAT